MYQGYIFQSRMIAPNGQAVGPVNLSANYSTETYLVNTFNFY